MSMIKIALLLKRRFPEFYDIRHYGKQASEQLVVKSYSTNYQKITIEEK